MSNKDSDSGASGSGLVVYDVVAGTGNLIETRIRKEVEMLLKRRSNPVIAAIAHQQDWPRKARDCAQTIKICAAGLRKNLPACPRTEPPCRTVECLPRTVIRVVGMRRESVHTLPVKEVLRSLRDAAAERDPDG